MPKRCNAICAVRSEEQIVWDNIIATQLITGIKQKYIIIRLIPSKHGIGVDNVAEDIIILKSSLFSINVFIIDF